MRLSRFHLATVKEVPADAEIVSHRLMLRAGMIRKLGAGIYTWTPLGLRTLSKVETVVREEMNRAGALEMLMPSIQPRELWDESGRWEKYGDLLLRIRDRKEQEFCYGPTHEEVVTDFARNELKSYKQLPVNFYQIQTKFRDEIRPRFGVMRAREFLMKDAYSFHLTPEDLEHEYRNMYDTYARIFTRLGLNFRAVKADSGDIGGDTSHEFHVLADSGEDAIAFSTGSDYAANVETAEALAPATPPAARSGERAKNVSTPETTTIDAVSTFLKLPTDRMLKTVLVRGKTHGFVMLCVRGDHEVNEVKAAKLAELGGEFALAEEMDFEGEIGHGSKGFAGPLNGIPDTIPVIVDRAAAAMIDFVCGANQPDAHIVNANWHDDAHYTRIADIRKVVSGDPSPDGNGTLRIARGIEVGHVFQLGQKYAQAMHATVLDAEGKARVMHMGCYGIGVSRIVGAAIEQNFDEAGIIWPEPMAPWRVAICIINPKNDTKVAAAAETLYAELTAKGIEVAMDDRGLRPGSMFSDIELIGIPHRIVVSERGLAAGTYEYRARRESESRQLSRDEIFALFG